MSLNNELQKLTIPGYLYFFDLDLSGYGVAEPLRFHCNGAEEQIVNGRIQLNGSMTFLGNSYDFVGIDQDGIQLSSGAKVNTPTLLIANNVGGVADYVSILCRRFKDMVGAKLTIYITTAANLNNAIDGHIKQVWYIEQRTNETAEAVEFELSSPIDFRGIKLPTRVIMNRCTWAMRGDYRGEECGYTGTKFFNEKGEPVSTIDQDRCGGCLSDCRLRFGRYATLPYGGQPAATY